jgi:hypothetical protein
VREERGWAVGEKSDKQSSGGALGDVVHAGRFGVAET